MTAVRIMVQYERFNELQLTPDNLNLQGKSKSLSYREFEANNQK